MNYPNRVGQDHCQYCDEALIYVPQYKRWYCYRCNVYTLPQPGQQEYIPQPVQQPYVQQEYISEPMQEPYEQQEYIPEPMQEPIEQQQYMPQQWQEPIEQQHTPRQEYERSYPEPKSKKLMTIAVVVVVIIVLLASFAYFIPREPIEEEEEEEKTITIYDVSKIRELDVLENVPYRYMTPDELREYLTDSIETEDIEEMEITGLIFHTLFLLDSDENLTQILLDAYSSQIAGFYNFENKEIVVIEGSSSLMDRITLSHELTHALQDQHFHLKTFRNATNGDEEMARDAVCEGDATLTMALYMAALPREELEALLEEIEEAPDTSEDMPYAIEQIMSFPYSYGLDFAMELYNEDGWDSVNNAYQNPPISTEQVMHFDKYVSQEAPLTVRFEPEIHNMTLIFNDTMGEFMVYIMLDHYIPSTSAANAAEGWGGDRLYYYKNETDFISVFKIEWDTQSDANEFYSTYASWVNELPINYRLAWINNCLQIDISQEVTTIYHSSNPDIIEQIK